MQKDKFYIAQGIMKDIQSLQIVAEAIEGDNIDLKSLDKLPVSVKDDLLKKSKEVIKKEVAKLIRQKEKEFNDL